MEVAILVRLFCGERWIGMDGLASFVRYTRTVNSSLARYVKTLPLIATFVPSLGANKLWSALASRRN